MLSAVKPIRYFPISNLHHSKVHALTTCVCKTMELPQITISMHITSRLQAHSNCVNKYDKGCVGLKNIKNVHRLAHNDIHGYSEKHPFAWNAIVFKKLVKPSVDFPGPNLMFETSENIGFFTIFLMTLIDCSAIKLSSAIVSFMMRQCIKGGYCVLWQLSMMPFCLLRFTIYKDSICLQNVWFMMHFVVIFSFNTTLCWGYCTLHHHSQPSSIHGSSLYHDIDTHRVEVSRCQVTDHATDLHPSPAHNDIDTRCLQWGGCHDNFADTFLT